MRQDALARRTAPDAPAPSDYDALCAALSATARGRAFLDEHAQRARAADTAVALEALSRLEAVLRTRDEEAGAKARLRSELRGLLAAIASARNNFGMFEGMLAKRETVMALFDMLELRIGELIGDAPEEREPEAPEPEPEAANENEVLAAALVESNVAAPVSAYPREGGGPELQGSESVVPDPRWSLPSGPAERRPAGGDERRLEQAPVVSAVAGPETFPAEIFATPRPAPVATVAAPKPPADIFARIAALTPAERIALFT
jgi:hypothetical protein